MNNERTRTLFLPHGGTVAIPMPGSKARFAVNPPSVLAESDGTSRLPTVLIGIAIGIAIGATAVLYWKS